MRSSRSADLARAGATALPTVATSTALHAADGAGLPVLALHVLLALPLALGATVPALTGAQALLDRAGVTSRAAGWTQRSAAAALGSLFAVLMTAPAQAALPGLDPTAATLPGLLAGALDVAPVALLAAALAFAPLPSKAAVRRLRRPLVRGLATAVAAVVGIGTLALPAVAAPAPARPAAPAGDSVCPDGARRITYDLSAFQIAIPLNGWGDHLPNGLVYALKGDDARNGKRDLIANPNRTEPLVIRANVGDCIDVVLRNDTSSATAAPAVAAVPGDDRPEGTEIPPRPRRVGIHPDGLVQFDPMTSSGAMVGGNPDTSVAPGEERTYTWYADHQGQAPVVDIANLDVSGGEPSTIQRGLYGAVIVHPEGSTWHDPVTGADLLDHGTGRAVQSAVYADVHAGEQSHRSFAMIIADEMEGILDRDGEEPTFPTTGLPDGTFGINYRSEPLRNRLRAILEHRGTVTPENPDGIAKTITLPNGQTYSPEDHFCDGYVPALDRVVDDPGAKCQSEESSLQSWVFGDEAKLVHREADGRIVVDSDLAIAKAYLGDDVRYHVVHPGAKETHPWHQHTQRWYADPDNVNSPRKDVQSLGPGEAFELRIEGGAGGTQGTIGDSIFHCHLYPHFAQGFWGHLRVFDRLRDGTQSYPDGTPIEALRQLPDRTGATPAPDDLHPGFPLFVEGEVGQRAFRIPHGVVRDDFAELRRPGDTVREPTALEAANLPALDEDEPGNGFIDPCPASAPVRTYRPHAVDVPIVYNSAGWKDPQGRVYVEESHKEDVLSGREPVQPYTIRARQGECLQILTTNDLHLDEDAAVPLDHVNRLDGAYRLPEETTEISTHPHLVKFDELGSDGTSVGWNYVSAAMPGQTYGSRWFVDQALRTVFFHDHQYANAHQQKGLFGALNVEPPDAGWVDPATGAPTDGTGPIATITSPSGPDFREFTLFYGDFNPMWKPNGDPIRPPGTPGDYAEDQGGYSINYRNEPFQIRTKPGAKGPKGDPAYVYSSAVHGDPSTPLLEAYSGDPVVIRNVAGAHEEVHNFTLHGHRWLNEPDNPMSTITDSQGLALAEYFNYEVRSGRVSRKPSNARERRDRAAVDTANGGPALVVGGAGAPGDYLYGSAPLDDQWLGMWGLLRTADRLMPGLAPLPDRAAPGKGDPWPALKPGQRVKAAKPKKLCPPRMPVRKFDISAVAAPITYNERLGDHDPDGLLYVRSEDARRVQQGRLEPGPLMLRARAGECLTITLRNELPKAGPPESGDDVRVPVDAPFPRGKRVSLHAGLVDTPVITSDGATVGYNFDQTVAPGDKMTMHWYVPTTIGRASIPLVDFGDRRGHRHHGLFGALLVEPPGATWTDPVTGEVATGAAADVHWTENGVRRHAREFVAMWQDGLTLKAPDGSVLPEAVGPDEQGHLDPYEAGHRGINYRTERLGPRLAAVPEQAWMFSSRHHGDPATPVFRANPGDPVMLRLLQASDRGRAHTIIVSGHAWNYQGSDPDSTRRSTVGMVLPESGWTLDLVGGAGGPARRPGDYLVRDGLEVNQVGAGLWFLLRVEPPGRGLRPLS